MRYDFLIDSYETERLKVLSVWSEFRDEDLAVRPKPDDPRGRSVHEHMPSAANASIRRVSAPRRIPPP